MTVVPRELVPFLFFIDPVGDVNATGGQTLQAFLLRTHHLWRLRVRTPDPRLVPKNAF